MEECPSKSKFNKAKLLIVTLFTVALILFILIIVIPNLTKHEDETVSVISSSALEKVIVVDELSTFTAVYNGIAVVNNEKKAGKVDYYVAYEAQVKAGIEFSDIRIEINQDSKKVYVTLPDVQILSIDVDFASMDFLFYNDKANASSVTSEAYQACIDDVKSESTREDEILKLARDNAKNTVTALIRPFLEQMDAEFELIIQ